MAEVMTANVPPPIQRPAWVTSMIGDASGRGVRVAVIDSGRAPDRQDSRILPGIGLVDGGYGLDLCPSQDDHDRIGHGSACIDIILALAPAVEILPIRVFGARLESSPEVIVEAIDRALEAGAQVLNLSLGHLLDHAARSLRS